MSASGVLELEVHATASSSALLIFKKSFESKRQEEELGVFSGSALG